MHLNKEKHLHYNYSYMIYGALKIVSSMPTLVAPLLQRLISCNQF